MKIPSQDIPYTEYHVEGTVSSRHLLHYEHKLTPPDSYTRPQLLSAFRTFNEIELHKVLDSAINSMPEFGTDTRLSDLEKYALIISNLAEEIGTTQAAVNYVYSEAPHASLQAHMRAAYQYLSQVTAALARMKDATSSTNAEEISAASGAFRRLETEATQINRRLRN